MYCSMIHICKHLNPGRNYNNRPHFVRPSYVRSPNGTFTARKINDSNQLRSNSRVHFELHLPTYPTEYKQWWRFAFMERWWDCDANIVRLADSNSNSKVPHLMTFMINEKLRFPHSTKHTHIAY